MNIEIVIPLGNGDPRQDMPNSSLLEFTCKNVKEQTIPVKLTFAIDKNLKVEKKNIIDKYADQIHVYDQEASYYAPGGIWLKIYESWEKSNCDYVAWSGYDDFSSPDRFEKQYKKITEENGNSCFCNSYRHVNGKEIIANSSHSAKFNLGKHTLFMGAFLLKRESILSSGIDAHKYKWSAYFEGLLNSYIIKQGKIHRSQGKFFYREHSGTLSNTCQEFNEWVKKEREKTNYSAEEAQRDWDSINFNKLNEDIRRGT
jgi:hypothetical protein